MDDIVHTFDHSEMKYKSSINDKIEYDIEDIIAFLLVRGAIFANTLTLDDPEEDEKLSTYAHKSIGLYVNCNDLFAWGCADAIQLNYFGVGDFYDHFMRGEGDVWCCKKRNLMPQKPVADKMRAKGIDIDSYGLEPNPSDHMFNECVDPDDD